MSDASRRSGQSVPIEPGVVIYDAEENVLGVVSGMTSKGFEVSIDENIESIDEEGYASVEMPDGEDEQAAKTDDESLYTSEQDHNPGGEFGEGYIMWRCRDCGAMDELDDGLPVECPDCGSEAVYKQRED
jgi:DNA-directed RNA polymerase subunit RPC12/RpoP